MQGGLDGKIAIIIGAGQSPGESVGNGRATALRLMQGGGRVLAVDRDLPSAEETVAMAGEAGGDSTALQADVTDSASLRHAVDVAMQRWGRVDILVYNVGVSVAAGDGPLDDITDDIFDRITRVNLRGAMMASKHVLPVMRQQRSGAILNVSSVSAIETTRAISVYGPTKAGLISFTQWLAVQNASHGIRANVILPGVIDTPMAVDTRARMQGVPREQVAAQRVSRVPLGRQGTGWDVANAAAFLVSDHASFITGASLPVDGGMLARVGF